MRTKEQWETCSCNSCSGHIEFEASHAGETIQCPHCSIETVLYLKPKAVSLAPVNKTGRSFFSPVVFGISALIVCLMLMFLAARSTRSTQIKPQANNKQTQTVTGAFGWVLGETLVSTNYKISTSQDGTSSLLYDHIEDPTISPFTSVMVSADKAGKIYNILCTALDVENYYEVKRELIATLTEKYGEPSSISYDTFEMYVFRDSLGRSVRLDVPRENKTKSRTISVGYSDDKLSSAIYDEERNQRQSELSNTLRKL